MPKQRTSKAKTTRRGEFETPLVPTPEYERWLSDEADAALLEIAKKEPLKTKVGSLKEKSRAKGKPENAEEKTAAAITWECLRHLYFTGQLSEFWQCWISAGESEALNRFRETVPDGEHILFATYTPYGNVLKKTTFPTQAWSELGLFGHIGIPKHAAETDKAVSPLRDTGADFYGLMKWACQQMESCKTGDGSPKASRLAIMGTGKIPERPVSHKPTHSQIILEIDWSAGIEDISKTFRETIQPLWKKHHPRGRKGRSEDPAHFFKGLVLLRRTVLREMEWKEAEWVNGVKIFGKKREAETFRGGESAAKKARDDAKAKLQRVQELLAEEEQRLCHGFDMKKWASNLARGNKV